MIRRDTGVQTGMRGERTEERGQCSVMTQTPTAEQDRQGSCEAGSTHRQHTHSNTNWGTMDFVLAPAPPPPHPNSQASPFTKLSLLSLKPHVSPHRVFPLFCSHSVKYSFIIPIFRLVGCSPITYPVY